MYIRKNDGPVEVTLPDGKKLNRSDLPPADTTRWVARLKLTVVMAVTNGLISHERACAKYGLSREELESWISLSQKDGAMALKATALHSYRQPRVE